MNQCKYKFLPEDFDEKKNTLLELRSSVIKHGQAVKNDLYLTAFMAFLTILLCIHPQTILINDFIKIPGLAIHILVFAFCILKLRNDNISFMINRAIYRMCKAEYKDSWK